VSADSLRYLAPLGRLFLATIFLASAVGKVMDWQTTEKMMADKGLPAVSLLLSVATALELIGGVSVLLGIYARVGALMLMAFLILVSLLMHNFWTLEGAQQMGEMISFMKNTSIVGGLILVLAYGAGPLSYDSFMKPRLPASLPGSLDL
jgi:putative oxidoreductase